MAARPGRDDDSPSLKEELEDLSKARKKFNDAMKSRETRSRGIDRDVEVRDRPAKPSTPPEEGLVGRGRLNALPVDAPARTPPSTSPALPRFRRRLARLSTRANRTDRESAVIFDFGLFEASPEARKFGELCMGMTRAFTGESTGGGSFDSCVVVSTANDHPVVEEFVIRLDSASPQFRQTPRGRNAAVKAVTSLVEEIGSPTSDTRVWLRSTAGEMGLPDSVPHKGYQEINGSTYPHIGGRNVSVHPTLFLDFLADLLDAYPEQLSRPDE